MSSELETTSQQRPLVKAEYSARGLDTCHFCGLKFNVGERIPRIIVGCGHTFCTNCLNYFLRNGRIRCPMCRKLLKGVESVDKLPLNFNILYEVVTSDPLLSVVNFDKCLQADLDFDEDDEAQARELAPYLCQEHSQRIKHFYCSEHPSIFCRECIKDLHNTDACFVVELYEIEKMRKLQEQNNDMNRKQLKVRQDGASDVYVRHREAVKHKNPLLEEVPQKSTRVNRHQQPRKPEATKHHQQQQYQQQQQHMLHSAPGYGQLPPGGGIVEFDTAHFDGQGMSAQQQHLLAQHQNMLMAQVADQQNFAYAHNVVNGEEQDFSSDEEAEAVPAGAGQGGTSSGDEGELDSAQKQKLRRDLLMMGYGEDDDFDEDEEAQAFIAGAGANVVDPRQLMMLQQQQQDLFFQQQQFQEAMRIQMQMKTGGQPDSYGAMGEGMGLRVKQRPPEHQQQEPPEVQDFEEELTSQEQFELDKKLFAQQMKQELLGVKSGAPPAKREPADQKATIRYDEDSEENDEGLDGHQDGTESFNSAIEIGEALLEENASGAAFEAPEIDSSAAAASEIQTNGGKGGAAAQSAQKMGAAGADRKSLCEISQNNESSSNALGGDEMSRLAAMKENTAPQ